MLVVKTVARESRPWTLQLLVGPLFAHNLLLLKAGDISDAAGLGPIS